MQTQLRPRLAPQPAQSAGRPQAHRLHHQTSAPLPHDQDELTSAGLTPVANQLMQPPRVGERRAVLECKVIDIVQFKNVWGQKVNGGLLPGDVVAVRVDNLLLKDGVDQTVAAHPGGQSKIGHYRLESGAIQQMVRSFSATVAARLLLYRPTGVLPAILDHKAPAVRMAQVKRTRAAGSAR